MIELSSRERIVLRSVIHSYILNANPVGSRSISKQYNLGLSPATIRNTMADLEELGLIEQPYTSAGRKPTDLGYRVYVDYLMDERFLSSRERKLIDGSVQDYLTSVNNLGGRPPLIEDLKIYFYLLKTLNACLSLLLLFHQIQT